MQLTFAVYYRPQAFDPIHDITEGLNMCIDNGRQ